jgi:glycine/D-amino acid oxidase-like deaminating enzyme
MNRSIDLMEQLADESGNVFRMNRRGYLYVTADESKIPAWLERSASISNLGAGPLRIHRSRDDAYQLSPGDGFHDQPAGADLLLGNELIRSFYPYLSDQAVAALHVRRAGWLSAQQLGMFLLERARQLGVHFELAPIAGIEVTQNRIQGVGLKSGAHIDCPIFVNAAGPYLKSVGDLLGVDIPVFSELHMKVAFKDSLGVVQRSAPLLIWDDPQILAWGEEEREELRADPETSWLAGPLPAGAHFRPEGSGESQTILLLWEYRSRILAPLFPPPMDEQFPEITLRGVSALVPGLKKYFQKMPKPELDGGYYTKTQENLPLVGPLPVQGAYLIGAVSGYGIMSALGLGELLAGYIAGAELPDYAADFSFARYHDPNHANKMKILADDGQL